MIPGLSQSFAADADAGWTTPLEVTAPSNGLSNGFLVPTRTGLAFGGFETLPPPGGTALPEEYYYTVEMQATTDAEDPQTGPRMSPILDDVVVLYAPWAVAQVVSEAEVGE